MDHRVGGFGLARRDGAANGSGYTSLMPTFEHSIVVRAPAAWLFDLMQDYDRRLEWDPFLSEARLVHAARAGLGVRAWCVDKGGRGMETQYVSFDPPRRVAVKMTSGPWMFKSFAGSWRYEPVDEGSTRVTFRYHVEARVSALSLGDRVLTLVMSRTMGSRLAVTRDRLEAMWAAERAVGAAAG